MGLVQNYGENNMEDTKVTIPYPARVKQATVEVNGVVTEAMSMSFSDKIMITITQNGRLAQWVG
jgi:proteasome assembly chaperone 3